MMKFQVVREGWSNQDWEKKLEEVGYEHSNIEDAISDLEFYLRKGDPDGYLIRVFDREKSEAYSERYYRVQDYLNRRHVRERARREQREHEELAQRLRTSPFAPMARLFPEKFGAD